MNKRKIILFIAFVLLLIGTCLLLYPDFARWQYNKKAASIKEDFDERMKAEERVNDHETELPPYLRDLYEAMQAYNRNIYENGQEGFKDAYSYQNPSFDLTEYGFPDNTVGYLDIPRMDISLPVILGATQENMELGAVHLTETSLPIGGINTNCVIAAHRGAATPMFRDIEALETGDKVYLTNPWETLTYRVVETKVIYPYETDEVKIQEGRDLLTFSTCHPLGFNYQRYIVYCERFLP